MAVTALTTLKNWFKTGLKPTQQHFWNLLDSFRHKLDKVPASEVDGLDELLQTKADLILGQLANSQIPASEVFKIEHDTHLINAHCNGVLILTGDYDILIPIGLKPAFECNIITRAASNLHISKEDGVILINNDDSVTMGAKKMCTLKMTYTQDEFILMGQLNE